MKNIDMVELIKRTDSILDGLEEQIKRDEVEYSLEEDDEFRISLLLGLLIKKGSMDALKQLKFYAGLQEVR